MKIINLKPIVAVEMLLTVMLPVAKCNAQVSVETVIRKSLEI